MGNSGFGVAGALAKLMNREKETPIDTEKRTNRREVRTGLIQWRVAGPGSFLPESHIETVETLPPGVYEIQMIGRQVGFVMQGTASDDLVRIDCSATDEVLREIHNFWSLAPKYEKHGVIHKRGFLLHGPPGSGKTSTIAMVSEAVVAEGGIVIQAGNGASIINNMIHALREIEPSRKIVVIMEDIDSYVEGGDEEELLSLLDGENNVGGIVYIATTNYMKRLPARIRNRPSRFDKLVHIGRPDKAYRLAYLQSRHLTLPEGHTLDKWAEDSEGLSIAHLKEIVVSVMCLGVPYDEALARVRSMAEEADKDAEGDF